MAKMSRRDIVRDAAILSAGGVLPLSLRWSGEVLASTVSRAASGTSAHGVPLGTAAESVFDYLIAHCTCNPPLAAFWRNPQDEGLPPDQNGWQGAQAIQSAIINYEAVHQRKYLSVVREFSDWMEYTYSGRHHLTTCETWPGWDIVTHEPVGKPPSHFCIWSDDSGWVLNMYLQIFQYTGKTQFLRYAYETLLNLDKRWGVPFQGNSRGLMYYDHQDRYSIYISAQILGALGLFEAFRESDPAKAERCLVVASRYYNFVEAYLHSKGPQRVNVTNTRFGVARDLFEEEATFGFGDEVPPPNAKSALRHQLFTATHMMMTAAYEMFHMAAERGGDVSQVDPQFRDFRARAIRAADAFTRVYPEGYAEQAAMGPGTVVMDIFDSNVNGFGCFWWAKHVVPLNPKEYGGVIVRTAREIIAEQGTGNVSSPCWNSVNCTADNSHSVFGKEPQWVMVRQASAASVIASANWIERCYPRIAEGLEA